MVGRVASTIIIGMKKQLLLLLALIFAQCCEPSCSDCSSSFCTACSEGYELTTDAQCVQASVYGCSLYDSSGKCLHCQPTFVLHDYFCARQYGGCLQSVLQSCNLCAPGKAIGDSSCRGTLNCANYETPCSRCRQGFTLRGGICIQNSETCMMGDPETGVCIMCNSGYQLVGYECISESIKPANCYIYDKNGSCRVCKTGYTINAVQRCVIPGNSICREFDENRNCLLCNNEYLVIINGSCIDVHCKEGAAGNCQKCEVGFSVKNGTVCVLTDPNCVGRSSQSSNRCDTCRLGYFVDINGTCSKLPSNCAAANIITGQCIQCLNGFNLNSNGECRALPQVSNCRQVNPSTGACLTCNFNFYVSNGLCARVSALCSGHDPTSGLCLGCKTGYTNIGGKCIDPNCVQSSGDVCLQCVANFSPDPLSGACRFTDPNCASANFLSCAACKPGYYLNPIICVAFPPFCTQMSRDFSSCLSCRSGWSLIGGQCVVPVTNCLSYAYNGSISMCRACVQNYQLVNSVCVFSQSAPTDRFCLLFNGSRCIQCSNRYYISNQVCVPVNPNCKDYSSDGNCTDCYLGYVVLGGNCVINTQVSTSCRTFVNQTCVSCYAGYFLDANTKNCTAISPLCRTSSESNGRCLSCFNGYSLSKGVCLATSRDANCIQFNLNGQCTSCSSRFFMRDSRCTPINPLCRTFNISNGHCLSCFPGYFLANGSCLVGSNPNSDANCKLRDPAGKCLQCYAGYYISANTTCMASNPLCKTIDFTNGACLTCYSGFVLQTGNCVVSSSDNSDPNCVTFVGTACAQCYTGFFVQEGTCRRINVLCRTYNSSNGFCLSCYPGYTLSSGQCVIPRSFTLSVQDPYCLQRRESACIQCSSGYFPLAGVCQIVNPLCRTANSLGSCTSCYSGYVIQEGNCEIVQQVNIPYCQTIVNGYCQRCIHGYYVQSPLQCSPASILCVTYDQNTGSCLSCITGYFLQVGQCIYPAMGFDQNCMNYDVSAYCSQCRPGFYLLNYVCARIDHFCVNFDTATSTCSRCGGGRTPNGAACA